MTTMFRRARFIAIAIPMVLVITATYHLGYPQYRQDGVAKPEIGNTLISIPMSPRRTRPARSACTSRCT